MHLLDLPVDVLYLILPYLDIQGFVSLTSSCRALHDPNLAEDANFWSASTRSTFRVPNQPVVSHDGKRWKSLYRRLLTQSRVYTWGSNAKANLGHSFQTQERLATLPPAMRRRHALRARNVSWPTEMENYRELGVIADLQTGGWSTSLLTSKGAIYAVGVMDGLRVNSHQPPYHQPIHNTPTPLTYPPGFAHPSSRYEPSTAIRQFSAGRSHVLGLSDTGRIWSWDDIDSPAINVKFLDIDIGQGNVVDTAKVKKVVAGWDKSAALVTGVGIVVWDVLHRGSGHCDIVEDTALVLQSAIVPDTGFRHKMHPTRASPVSQSLPLDFAESTVGELLNFTLLERYVLFNTSTGKVFAGEIAWDDQVQHVERIFPIPMGNASTHEAALLFATDVQGSFHNFAIFCTDGVVLPGTQEYLEQLQNPPTNPHTTRHELSAIPALQHSGVIALAFGDYHFHALHASGTITSYGNEPQACGSLGLGGHGDPEGRLRGIRYAGVGGDGRLVPHASVSGRQVWFEPEKRDWIRFLVSGGCDPEEAAERLRMCAETVVQGEISEWVEQEGRAWETKYLPSAPAANTSNAEDDDDLSAYFALSVTAAGWHSGALVLVNETKAERIKEGCLIRQGPREERPSSDLIQDDTETARQGSPSQPSTLTWIIDNVRWALGLADSPSPGPATDEAPDRANSRPVPPHSTLHFTNPVMHGAALDADTPYRWAADSFPRLRLSDGRIMPGTVGLNEYRSGQPDWSSIALQN